MVSTAAENLNIAGNKQAQANGAVAKAMSAQKLPQGNYTLVSVDIDTTGRRLIDEIVQLAAFTPKDHFEQYIMPYMNLNPAARQRHQVRVISIGFYRMLKSMQTYKIIKSKSEIAALKDFLDWLEALKAKDGNSLGVIIIYHEERKFIPYMILQALKKYNLLDRFVNTVVSFTNSSSLAHNVLSSDATIKEPHTLRRLARAINAKFADYNNNELTSAEATGAKPKTPRVCGAGNGNGSDNFDGNASVRARLAYEVAHYLCNLESRESLDSSSGYAQLMQQVCEYAKPIECELHELKTQNEIVERQNSFRPVFFPYFRATLYHRVRAVKFRIVLAENGYDLNELNAIWTRNQRDGLLSALQSLAVLKPEERHELVDLFDSYFDPKKTVIGPIVKNNRRRNRRVSGTPRDGHNNNEGTNAMAPSGSNNNSAEPGAGGDKQTASGNGTLPDSTTKSPMRTNGNFKSGRGKRFNPRMRNGFRTPRKTQQHETTQTTPSSAAAVAPATAAAATKVATINAMSPATAMPQPQRIAVTN